MVEIEEATVDQLHRAFESGDLTSRELVEQYLERIDAYDQAGPELNSIIEVNDAAVDRADELDAKFA